MLSFLAMVWYPLIRSMYAITNVILDYPCIIVKHSTCDGIESVFEGIEKRGRLGIGISQQNSVFGALGIPDVSGTNSVKLCKRKAHSINHYRVCSKNPFKNKSLNRISAVLGVSLGEIYFLLLSFTILEEVDSYLREQSVR